jgi:arylsulfatase A-like enzyme
MNFIVVMSDTLRPDHLAAYGNDWCHTPASAAFARDAVVFDNAFVGSFPTIPNRTDLLTGRFGEPVHPWLPLDYGAVTLPRVLAENGYITQIICDTPHLINGGHNFDYPFQAWDFIRGSEVDAWGMDSDPVALPYKDRSKCSQAMNERFGPLYMRNRREQRVEEDYVAHRTFQSAINWLERNRGHEKFLLWIDGFDPHEPALPPQHYTDLYDPGYQGDCYVAHADLKKLTPAEIKNVLARYAGMVTFLDKQVGRLLDALERLDLARDTCVVWISDHGTQLNEHGRIMSKDCAWDEVARTVMMVRAPRMKKVAGKRLPDLVQPADLAPTLLEMAGVRPPAVMQGRSFLPLLRGRAFQGRDVAITLRSSLIADLPKGKAPSILARDGRWVYAAHPDPKRRSLYDTRRDPGQTTDVLDRHSRVAAGLHAATLDFLRTHNAPPQLVRYFETGDPGDMTGYVPVRPGCENFQCYFTHAPVMKAC